MRDFSRSRHAMVERLRTSFPDATPALLSAIESVPRHLFVGEALWHRAYEETSLPIGMGQTLSQPSTVLSCLALLALKPDDCLLEIGSGSGYVAAVASRLCRKVYGMERLMPLVISSRKLLERLGVSNASILFGDGSEGWGEHSPYDCVLMSAAAPSVPESLSRQLRTGSGRLVLPVGTRSRQSLQLWLRGDDGELGLAGESGSCKFVPLIGRGGWSG